MPQVTTSSGPGALDCSNEAFPYLRVRIATMQQANQQFVEVKATVKRLTL